MGWAKRWDGVRGGMRREVGWGEVWDKMRCGMG